MSAVENVLTKGSLRVDNVVTHGTFELDGGSWEVDNNVWIIGDDSECVIIDAAHTAAPILDALGARTVKAILCTHGHNDHITAVGDVQGATAAPSYLSGNDRMLWDEVYPDKAPDHDLENGDTISVAGIELSVLTTPGHSPGAVCFYAPELGCVFTGDTLFEGGPGATGRSYSDFGEIINSIKDQLLTLHEDTLVFTGHGDATSIGDEKPHLDEWIARGH